MSHHHAAARLTVPGKLLTSPSSAHGDATALSKASAAPTVVAATNTALRNLWVAHVFWIRRYELAAEAHDDSHRKIAESAVVANAAALAAMITPIVGHAAADRLRRLLLGRLAAVCDFKLATAASSQFDRDEVRHALTTIAREIARSLKEVNPYVAEDAIFGVLLAHDVRRATHRKQVAGADRQIARRGKPRRQDDTDVTQIVRSHAPARPHPAVLPASSVAHASSISPPRAHSNRAAKSALEDVRDPGWVIVAGMAVFFAVAAAVIALT